MEGGGKKVGFTFRSLYGFYFAPHFLKRFLHNIPCGIFIADVLQHKTVNAIGMHINTMVIFLQIQPVCKTKGSLDLLLRTIYFT
jgi:hypothetical protein